MIRRALVVVLSALSVHGVASQQPANASATPPSVIAPIAPLACDGSGTVADTYTACALRSEGTVIRRGSTGEIVARPGFFFRPAAVTRLVSGDSAMAYARLFEHQQRRAQQFGTVGGLALIGSVVLAQAARSSRNDPDRQEKYLLPAMGLSLVGLTFSLPVGFYSHRAAQSLSTALWWNNLRFVH